MKCSFVLLMTIILVLGCHKDNPLVSEPPQLPEIPHVVVSQSNYLAADIQSRVPDTTYLNKCCSLYRFAVTDSLKGYVANVLIQKAQLLNQDTLIVSQCLDATGQFKTDVMSLLYFAERAKYESKECWIFEFSWGIDSSGIGHYRCFVMDTSTKDTLLFITCR
jgi:hypothetical protein